MKKIIVTLGICLNVFISNAQVRLYGLTAYGGTSGGSSGIGTIFHYNPSTTVQTVDKSFVYTTAQSAARYGAFADGGNNKFYAMSTYDGLYDKGSIFEWDPVTNITVKKIDFNGINGATPQSTLTLNNGMFNGMTSKGGANNMGVIFEWDPVTNIYTKKIDFDGTNGNHGSQPSGALTLNSGKFYGMTSSGGSNNRGVIFEWDPVTNTYTKKIDFNGSNGGNPYGALTIKDGKFYGMTYYGGANEEGAIFEWDPVTNIYTKKIDLNTGSGTRPYGSMFLICSKFYGMTYLGGTNNSGVIFEWDPVTNIYTKKLDFNGSNGGGPNGSFTASGGKLYGITEGGGANGKGVIFEWDPGSNIYTRKINFGGNSGDNPTGSLALLSGKFYGMNQFGGGVNFSNGVIFEWDLATNIYIKKLNFKTTNGSAPNGSLTVSGNKIYGMTSTGGANNDGVIFEWDPVTNSYTIKFDFSYSATGSSPQGGALSPYNGKFYGTAPYGGTFGKGVIFEWDPVTNIYIKKIDLNGSGVLNPSGYLVFYAGKFYGTTSFGTAPYARGVIFEWDPTTNIYTVKNGFDGGANGGVPVGTLTLSGNKFYGITSQGGANNAGDIFEWDPATNVLTKKIDFNNVSGTPGSLSGNSLILSGSKFYGMTQGGGTNGYGVIFEWDPIANNYIKKIDLNAADGGSPVGSLMLSGGKFYGMTKEGGSNSMGVIFQWDAATNTYTKLVDFNSVNGANPYGNLVEYSNSALPIHLLSFTAALQNTNNVKLQWQIATAEDAGKYALQRSIDGGSFATINEQTGNAFLNQFSYIDNSLSGGTYYYRLKMTDKDGKITFSNIAVLKVGSKNLLITIYPNPVKRGETLQLSLQNDNAQKIEVITMAGHVVYCNQLKATGNFGITVPASLAAGEYLLKVVSEKYSSIQKIIIR